MIAGLCQSEIFNLKSEICLQDLSKGNAGRKVPFFLEKRGNRTPCCVAANTGQALQHVAAMTQEDSCSDVSSETTASAVSFNGGLEFE